MVRGWISLFAFHSHSNCICVGTTETELESLNTSCEGEESGECAVDAVEDRKVLQQALSLQSDLIKEEELLDAPNSKHSEEREDHSFNHYVDYRDIGTYESH